MEVSPEDRFYCIYVVPVDSSVCMIKCCSNVYCGVFNPTYVKASNVPLLASNDILIAIFVVVARFDTTS